MGKKPKERSTFSGADGGRSGVPGIVLGGLVGATGTGVGDGGVAQQVGVAGSQPGKVGEATVVVKKRGGLGKGRRV